METFKHTILKINMPAFYDHIRVQVDILVTGEQLVIKLYRCTYDIFLYLY